MVCGIDDLCGFVRARQSSGCNTKGRVLVGVAFVESTRTVDIADGSDSEVRSLRPDDFQAWQSTSTVC